MKRTDVRRASTRGAALVAALLLALAVLAPVYAKDKNPAKELVEKSVKASGGLSKLTGWTTRIDKGHMKAEWPGWGELHANYTRWIRKPDGLKIDQDFAAFDHPFFFTYYYDKGEVWAVVNLGVRQNPTYTQRLTKTMKTVDGIAYYLAQCDTFYLALEVPDDSLVRKLEHALKIRLLQPASKMPGTEERFSHPMELTLGDIAVMQKSREEGEDKEERT